MANPSQLAIAITIFPLPTTITYLHCLFCIVFVLNMFILCIVFVFTLSILSSAILYNIKTYKGNFLNLPD